MELENNGAKVYIESENGEMESLVCSTSDQIQGSVVGSCWFSRTTMKASLVCYY